MKKLLLFDIDGTLITSGGAGETALCRSLKEHFDIDDDLKHIEFGGATDSGLAKVILSHHGLPVTPANVTALFDGYFYHLEQLLPQRSGRTLPGILTLLEALRTRPGIVLALLTGNLARGAEIKLSHYGLWHYFEFGAFADDHADRNRLGPFARARAEENHGEVFLPEAIYVIGDTPKDIACGKTIGATTVAIATGNYPRALLAAHQPDFLFDDLFNTAQVIAELGW